MHELIAKLMLIAALIGPLSACGKIQLTPSLIAAELTTLQAAVAALPNVPPSVSDALAIAVQAATSDASGASWATTARQALTTLYSDLPAADQQNPVVNVTVVALEAALEALNA